LRRKGKRPIHKRKGALEIHELVRGREKNGEPPRGSGLGKKNQSEKRGTSKEMTFISG